MAQERQGGEKNRRSGGITTDALAHVAAPSSRGHMSELELDGTWVQRGWTRLGPAREGRDRPAGNRVVGVVEIRCGHMKPIFIWGRRET